MLSFPFASGQANVSLVPRRTRRLLTGGQAALGLPHSYVGFNSHIPWFPTYSVVHVNFLPVVVIILDASTASLFITGGSKAP